MKTRESASFSTCTPGFERLTGGIIAHKSSSCVDHALCSTFMVFAPRYFYGLGLLCLEEIILASTRRTRPSRESLVWHRARPRGVWPSHPVIFCSSARMSTSDCRTTFRLVRTARAATSTIYKQHVYLCTVSCGRADGRRHK